MRKQTVRQQVVGDVWEREKTSLERMPSPRCRMSKVPEKGTLKGHYTKKCRSAKNVHDITQGHMRCEEEEFAFLGEVRSGGEDEWIRVLQLNGKEMA